MFHVLAIMGHYTNSPSTSTNANGVTITTTEVELGLWIFVILSRDGKSDKGWWFMWSTCGSCHSKRRSDPRGQSHEKGMSIESSHHDVYQTWKMPWCMDGTEGKVPTFPTSVAKVNLAVSHFGWRMSTISGGANFPQKFRCWIQNLSVAHRYKSILKFADAQKSHWLYKVVPHTPILSDFGFKMTLGLW